MVVKTWGAAVGKETGKALPDCGRCRRPEAKNQRASWGCDKPTKKAQFVTGCSRCFGGDSLCPDCTDGLIHYHRCPSSVMEVADAPLRRAVGRAVRSYVQFDGRSVLPSAGGFEDQSPQFAQVVDVIDHERGRLDAALSDYRARRAPKPPTSKPSRR